MARDRGAVLDTFTHPSHRGPDGGPLRTDVAVRSEPGNRSALVLVSGTHGAEGFAGSACQLAVLADQVDLGRGIDLVAVHALNPFGFAHLRRVNEDNIDINRNFVDHREVGDDKSYDEAHPWLVPADWEGPAHAAADEKLMELGARIGLRTLQAAITGGQYRHPDGLFYGGREPCWSNRTWREIVRRHIARYHSVGYIDLHTGLGQWAGTEPIFRGGRDRDAMARARAWYGDALTSDDGGTASSTPIDGNTARALAEELPASTVLTAITLEFGTREALTVLRALQADNWLWQRADPRSDPRRAEIHGLMRDAFSPLDVDWQNAVVARGGRVIAAAVAGLADT